MRLTLTIVSLLAIVALAIQVRALPPSLLLRALVLYLGATAVLTSVCIAANVVHGIGSVFYFRIFYGAIFVTALACFYLCSFFLDSIPQASFSRIFVFVTLMFVCSVCAVFADSIYRVGMLSIYSGVHLLTAGMFLFCGVVALASLAFPTEIVGDGVRLGLGLYWVSIGTYLLGEAGLYLRAHADVVTKISPLPTVAAIVAFFALAYFISSQKEISREPDAATVQIHHVAALEVATQMRVKR